MPRLVLSQIHVKWFALTSIFKLTTSADWEIIGNQIYQSHYVHTNWDWDWGIRGLGDGGLGNGELGNWGLNKQTP